MLRLLLLFVIAAQMACQNQNEPSRVKAAPSTSEGRQATPPPPPSEEKLDSDGKLDPKNEQQELEEWSFSSAVARIGSVDSIKKLVRSADLKFKVENVPASTEKIEEIGLRMGGFILRSNLRTDLHHVLVDPLNADSCLERSQYSIANDLVIRVPALRLDSTLRLIGRLAIFWDKRDITAEEVDLTMLATQLRRKREQAYQAELRATPKRNSTAANNAATLGLNSKERADDSHLENLKLEDRVRYSTVSVHIYSAPQIAQDIVANAQIKKLKPAFWAATLNAIGKGADILRAIFLALLSSWGLILAAALTYFVARPFVHKFKRAKGTKSA
jgi:biopolymer transport protein ExbD